MPNWKKIALSGSNPEFSSLIVDNAIQAGTISGSFSGSYVGDGSALTGLSLPQVTTVTDTFTSTTSKSVTHNFGTKNVIVQVYDTNDAFMIPSSIVTTDTNSVDISFANQASGRVVVAKGGHLVSGSVDFDNLANTPTLLSSSAQITGFGFISQSSDGAISSSAQIVALGANIVSSSAQIATDISGSFVATSASFATTIGSLTSDYTELTNVPADIVSSSAQIGTDISGSFTSTSESIASDIATISTGSLSGSINYVPIYDSSGKALTESLISQSSYGEENDTQVVIAAQRTVINSQVVTTTISSPNGDALRLGSIYNTGEIRISGADIETATDAAKKILTVGQDGQIHTADGNESISGSFSGSFIGDGSGLTGVGTPGAISSSLQIAALGSGILSGSQTLFSQSFSSATAVTASHGFGTKEVVVSVYDNNDNLFFPTNIKTATTSAVHLDFNTARSGRVIVSKGGHVVDVQATATSASFATSTPTASFASTGPFLSNTGGTVDGDLTLTGTLTAQTYIVSSSVTYMTQSFSSGSTIFGDSLDDTHLFTGSLNVTGSANLVASQSVNTRDDSSLSMWAGSQAQYDALGSYNSNTIYFVT